MNGSQIKVVALNGSARKGGNTAILLRCVLKELENEGIETELIELSGAKIHGCLACGECSKNKDRRCAQKGDMGNALIDKMAEADGILLGSPTALNHFFLISEMIIPGSSYWNIGIGREIGDVERDEEGMQTMKTLGQNMAWLLKKING